MFAAEMVGGWFLFCIYDTLVTSAFCSQGCGIGAWESNSRIVRAVSTTANGEYEVQEVIKPAFAHEPVVLSCIQQ